MTAKTIPVQNIGQLRARIAELNARAEKLGVEGIEFAEITSYCVSPTRITRKTAREVVEVEVVGGRVGLGWNLLGVIEHTAAGNILRAAPGQTVPESYRDAARECDHCGTTRARQHTFLAETPDGGSIVQLGRSCLRDYLGHIDAEQLASWMTSVAELTEDGDDDGWMRSGKLPTMTFEVVAAAAADFRMRGRYVPVSIDDSTRGRVAIWLAPDSKFRTKFIRETGFAVTAEDTDRARELLDWVTTAEGNGYLANLRTVAAAETVKTKNMGLLVSITAAHRTAAERVAEQVKRDAEKAAADAERADAPTGRVEITGTVERLTERENDYGISYKMIIETDEGWRLWVTQPQSLFEIADDDCRTRSIAEGERVAMTVTVKPADDDKKFAFGSRPAKAVLAE